MIDMEAQSLPLAIGALVYDGIDQIDITGPFEVLSRLPGASYTMYGLSTDFVRDLHGFRIMPDAVLEYASSLDILHVPGGPGQEALMRDERVMRWLRLHFAGARLTFSVCTGALLLGAAGLLTGRRVTTHWTAMSLLPIFGATPVDERVVHDGALVSAAGVTAGIDGALAVAASIAGIEIAQQIQLAIEYAPEPPFAAGTPATAPEHVLRAVQAQTAELRERRMQTALGLRPPRTHP